MQEAERAELQQRLHDDRFLAHQTLFAARHELETPWAHKEILEAVHGLQARQLIEGFRGVGKTTLLEETAILRAVFGEFKHMVILGASYGRACERLDSIQNEFTTNDMLIEVFGDQRKKGRKWTEGKIILANGICIQALGRDQSMTGIKYLNERPDAALVDDVEDPEEVRTDLDREASWRWFLRTFMPSLKHQLRTWIRVLGTRRGSGSLPERLEKAGWPTLKIPIKYQGSQGQWIATWPGKFPLSDIERIEWDYRRDMHEFNQEFMCQPVSEQARVFTHEMLRTVPRVRTYEPVMAMLDPARTTQRHSATTGLAVWSWVRGRLIIWKGVAQKWLPDEIIAEIFNIQAEFSPIWIGVEKTGLNEWLGQPLRQEAAKRGVLLPLKLMEAPRGKYDFISMLQPYFKAGEVEFAASCPELEEQLLNFRVGGPIDAPNALAYALTMRPGQPVYDNFATEHVAETALVDRAAPLWLAANAVRGLVTLALLQSWGGQIRIIADFAMEGEPMEVVPLLARDAAMLARMSMTAVCGPQHFDQWTNVGLVQAFARVPMEVERGGAAMKGRDVLRREFGRMNRGLPAVIVGKQAPRVLNGLGGGYAWVQSGKFQGDTEPGLYRVLMEGIESCLASMEYESDRANANWATTRDGRRYLKYGTARDTAEFA